MKFFDRTDEIKTLREVNEISFTASQFTVLTGRRRIGKTSLVFHAYQNQTFLYFFVGRKTEKDLCEGYSKEIEAKLNIPVLGNTERFSDIFEYVLKLAMNQHIILFIDEFQDFMKVNPSIFSDIQRLWDSYKDKVQLNLIVSGSINSMMHHLFFDNREPLYQRMSRLIKLRPFSTSVITEILQFYSPEFTPDDLLALYTFTGGVAKYIELLIDSGAYTREKMIERMVSDGSPFIEEGKIMLLGEFGKDYGRYFSILSAIASGHTQRSRIEDIVGEEVSGYITRLEKDYEIISKKQPLLEKSATKNVRYEIHDNFLTFWFRFIYRYNYLLEINNYGYLQRIVKDKYDLFSGWMLERWFTEKLKESGEYSRIGNWWDRKGENEIDIVAVDELSGRMEFYEVKRNPRKISIPDLEKKTSKFFQINPALAHFERGFHGLSLENMVKI